LFAFSHNPANTAIKPVQKKREERELSAAVDVNKMSQKAELN